MPNPTLLVVLLAGLALMAGISSCRDTDSVSADHSVVTRDIRNSTINNINININSINIPPEQLEALILDSAKHEKQVEELSSQLGVTKAALTKFFQTLREQNVPLEKLPDTLATIAQRFREMQERLAVLNPEDPATQALIEKARAALDAGHYDLADALLSQAEAAEQAAARKAEQLVRDAQAAADRRWLNTAAARAERGELSLTRLNYREAAKHFQAATEMTPASAPTERGIYRRRWADVLFWYYGEQRGDNAALAQAIDLYRQALIELPRAQQPQEWAQTQNNLGNALAALGERDAGTTRLEEAVAAYRAALEERTRARAPLDWAKTQANLGNALAKLAERREDPIEATVRLDEAVAAYRAALEEITRARIPLFWAIIQKNLGDALVTPGARARQEEAVAAYRAALEEITRARIPLFWAQTQWNLAIIYRALKDEAKAAAICQELREADLGYQCD